MTYIAMSRDFPILKRNIFRIATFEPQDVAFQLLAPVKSKSKATPKTHADKRGFGGFTRHAVSYFTR